MKRNLTLPRRVSRDTAPNVTGLRAYQCIAVMWLRARISAILGDEMRLGKTASALRALPDRASVIVVCPAIACLVWRDEIAKWRPDLRPVLGGLRAPGEGEVVIVSYDSLPDLDTTHGESCGLVPYTLLHCHLILDEVHYAMASSAQRTIKVRLLGQQVRVVWGLTGTPMIGELEDLLGVLTSCRLGWTGSEAGLEVGLDEHLSKVMLRRTRQMVYYDLPAKQYQYVPVPAPDDLP